MRWPRRRSRVAAPPVDDSFIPLERSVSALAYATTVLAAAIEAHRSIIADPAVLAEYELRFATEWAARDPEHLDALLRHLIALVVKHLDPDTLRADARSLDHRLHHHLEEPS